MTTPPATGDVTGHMTRGAAWMVGIRWCVRLLDTVMLVVLARLLSPYDFGVFATAMLVVGLLEILADAGIDIALMRRRGEGDNDAAWTIQIVQGLLIAGALVLLAPVIAAAFDEPELTTVVRLLALRPALMAFNNIGVLTFTKELDFRNDFWFTFVKKTSAVAVTLALAPFLQSYMAMVWGVVGGAALTLIASYRVHPYRPRFTLNGATKIWFFSSWMVLYYAAEDVFEKVDRFVVASVADTAALGRYSVGWAVAATPLQGILVPFWRAFIPAYARLLHDPPALVVSYLKALGWTSVIACAVGFGTAAVAGDLVLVLLGDEWLSSVHFVQWLALVPAVAGVVDSALMVVTVVGRARAAALHSCFRVAVSVAIIPAVGSAYGVDAVPVAYLLIAIGLMPVPFVMLRRMVPITYGAVVGRVWRPALAGLTMLGVVRLLHPEGIDLAAVRLAFDVAVGGTTFIAMMAVLWIVAGRPEGPEADAVKIIAARLPGAGIDEEPGDRSVVDESAEVD